jgi:hypothetical protein
MMKTKIKIILGCLIVVTFLYSFNKDEITFAELIKKIEIYNQSYPQEKVYLQLDKPYYSIGDDIWFKAYVINSASNSPSLISKTIYAELINEKDSIVNRLTLPLSVGISWGDFALPDSLIEGNYRIRAYTNWMRNFNEDFVFTKTIKIGHYNGNKFFSTAKYITKANSNQVTAKILVSNKDNIPYANTEFSYRLIQSGSADIKGKIITTNIGEITIPFNTSTTLDKLNGRIELTANNPNFQKFTKIIPINIITSDVDVQFMPEGGNLINNIPTKVAFKAINTIGKGVNATILIKNQNGEQIEEVNSEHLGMGSFIINPQNGLNYYAELILSDGTIKKVNLPKALPDGYSLATNNLNADKISVKIMLSENLVGNGDINILAQNGNRIVYSAKATPTSQIVNFSIPKENLPSGIITITLFNAKNQPVCERLIFNSNKKNIITLTTEKSFSISKKKEKINLNLKATNEGKPIQGSFSIAINNTSKIESDELNESNILTSLLLTSDLSGYIENPNFYFLGDSVNKQKIDLLLLTQGWKRYNIKDVINTNNIPITYQPERGLVIEGQVNRGKNPVSKLPIYLFASAGKTLAIDTLSDENGKFVFDNLFFNDSTSFMIKAGKEKRSDYVIKLTTNSAIKVDLNKNKSQIEINVNDAILNYLKKNDNYINEMIRIGFLKKPIELNTVEIKGKKKKVFESANFNGPGNADVVITSEDLKNIFSLKQYLEGRVSGIRFEGNVDTAILIRNSPPERMKVLINGNEDLDDEALNTVPVADIETIEVLKSTHYTFIYGTSAGVILITTKTGKKSENNNYSIHSISTVKPKGYYFSREFYVPKYGTTEQEKDFRTTVYWKPNLVSSKEGELNIEYLNTNEAGNYRIIIEGIDSFGNLARKTLTYKVE